MQQQTGHLPAAPRHLPKSYYGAFDVQPTPDGGKRYSLPHTLWHTMLATTTTPFALLALLPTAALIAQRLAGPERSFTDLAMMTAFAYCPVHAAAAAVVGLVAAVTGLRTVTRLTIRADGLIWNDTGFFPAAHLWMISYGTTHAPNTPKERFEPKIEIQIGTQTITLAEGLDVTATRLFQRLFQEDIRRYWHRHN
jgi:hypothetical protein